MPLHPILVGYQQEIPPASGQARRRDSKASALYDERCQEQLQIRQSVGVVQRCGLLRLYRTWNIS